jgi:hypothetical protein
MFECSMYTSFCQGFVQLLLVLGLDFLRTQAKLVTIRGQASMGSDLDNAQVTRHLFAHKNGLQRSAR